jgi:ribosome-binding factor A
MDAARARKLAESIAQIVAEMLERRVKDPRLGFVTVTEARITGDLREATVFYTVYGSAQERADTAVALASATGLIRSEVGHQTGLKHTPSITFREDTVPDTARNIEELVARARDADAAVAAARQGATPAGDADPYRIPHGAAADEDEGEDDAGEDDAGGQVAGGQDADGQVAGGQDADGQVAGGQVADGQDPGDGRRPGDSAQRDGTVRETPAGGEQGAGYSRS